MAKRRKTRTHDKGSATAKTANGTPGAPKSFVVKQGHVGHSIASLARDMRKVMEPNTATRLKVRLLQALILPKTKCPHPIGKDEKQNEGLSRYGPSSPGHTCPGVCIDSKGPHIEDCQATIRPDAQF